MPPDPASLGLPDLPDLPDLCQGANNPPSRPDARAHPLAPEPAWLDAMAMAMLSCVGGSGGGSGPQGCEGRVSGSGSSSGEGRGGITGSGGALARAAAAFAVWGHSPPAAWVEAMSNEVAGSSFLLSAGGSVG